MERNEKQQEKAKIAESLDKRRERRRLPKSSRIKGGEGLLHACISSIA